MSENESLCRFGTTAFAIEVMREHITRSQDGSIKVGVWWDMVPEAYIWQVWPLIDEVAARHRGQRLTDDLVCLFVDDLNREIGAKLQPVEP